MARPSGRDLHGPSDPACQRVWRPESRGAGTPKGNGDNDRRHVVPPGIDEPGGRNAERQWRQRPNFSGFGGAGREPGGRNAERQWRLKTNDRRHVVPPGRAGGPERRKAMETHPLQKVAVAPAPWGAGGPERRKAMETSGLPCGLRPVCHWSRGAGTPKGNGDFRVRNGGGASEAAEPGGRNAERQWRHGSREAAAASDPLEPGGRNAERQWRREAPRRLRGGRWRAGGPERRKAMETWEHRGGVMNSSREPGGRNAERQWRLRNGLSCLTAARRAGGPERRKAMETGLDAQQDQCAGEDEPGGRNAERQWRRDVAALRVEEPVVEPGGRNAERQWRRIGSELAHEVLNQEPGGRNAERQRRLVEFQGRGLAVLDLEPGGRNAERQWRLPGSSRQRVRCPEPGGRNAERQWRPHAGLACKVGSGSSRGAGTPKGNGDTAVIHSTSTSAT